MAKCTVIGKTPQKTRKPKEIEFVMQDNASMKGGRVETPNRPSDFKHIELIARGFASNYYDIMFAYDSNRSNGMVFYGHWNDGGHYDSEGNWVS